jgi:ATP-dependent DNA helicase RecG
MPIQLLMFEDRMEIRNPGGIYGRIRVDQLGKMQPDTRNPVLAAALEVLGVTENRYSGIPTIRRTMKEHGLREPEFQDERGCFIVKFYKEQQRGKTDMTEQNEDVKNLILFCKTPRTRKEISEYLGLTSVSYAIQSHVMPLVEQNLIHLSIPEKPGSPKQLYYSGQLKEN